MWDKVDLENLIFYISAKEKRPVFARRGRLYAVRGGALLRALERVYNRFFFGENQLFLQTDLERERTENADFSRGYLAEQKANPPFPSFHLSGEILRK